MTLYKNIPLARPGFFQRLFKQQPPENALIEVNNLLAGKELQQITPGDISDIERRYQINLGLEYPLNLQEFYAVNWNRSLLAGPENSQTSDALAHLAKLFGLNEDTVAHLHRLIGVGWFRKVASGALKQSRLSAEDHVNFELIRQRLRLDPETAGQILEEEKQLVIETFAAPIIKRERCKPDEVAAFKAIVQSLDIKGEIVRTITEKLNTYKLYWELEHLPLGAVRTTMTLQKSETCYYQVGQVKWLETRNDRYGTARYEHIASGSLCLTNKRLLFEGAQKNTNIPYDRIGKISQEFGGLLIQKDKGKNPVIQYSGDKNIMEILLRRILKEFKGFELR